MKNEPPEKLRSSEPPGALARGGYVSSPKGSEHYYHRVAVETIRKVLLLDPALRNR